MATVYDDFAHISCLWFGLNSIQGRSLETKGEQLLGSAVNALKEFK